MSNEHGRAALAVAGRSPEVGALGVDVVELAISDALDAAQVPRVRASIVIALALQPRLLIIDLVKCRRLDAAGIALLLAAIRLSQASDCRLVTRGSPIALRSRRAMRTAMPGVMRIRWTRGWSPSTGPVRPGDRRPRR